jgi:CobQ-like glutamine amidotransferase family enzyme
MSRLTIAHLYPGEMNIYGDMGNVIALTRRLEWRGFEVVVLPVEPAITVDWSAVDIVFGGGGQDSGQLRIGGDLVKRGDALREAAADGMPMLLVCGLYQLFGHSFVTESGAEIPGIGVFDATTRASSVRMIGNVVLESELGPLVGFENHSGQTALAKGQTPLGRVVKGYGNNERSRYEGAITNEAIGTYLHGPVLPKNPALADGLILAALKRRGLSQQLEPLDDQLERQAAVTASKRPQ